MFQHASTCFNMFQYVSTVSGVALQAPTSTVLAPRAVGFGSWGPTHCGVAPARAGVTMGHGTAGAYPGLHSMGYPCGLFLSPGGHQFLWDKPIKYISDMWEIHLMKHWEYGIFNKNWGRLGKPSVDLQNPPKAAVQQCQRAVYQIWMPCWWFHTFSIFNHCLSYVWCFADKKWNLSLKSLEASHFSIHFQSISQSIFEPYLIYIYISIYIYICP